MAARDARRSGDPASLLARQLGYWRAALAGAPPQIELPADRDRPAACPSQRRHADGPLSAGWSLPRPARPGPGRDPVHGGCRPRSPPCCACGAGSDIPLGTPVAGRADEALEDLVGFFANTLVLRTDVSGKPAFRELLHRVREADLGAYAHQDVPFEHLVEALNPERSLARHPLFQVMIAMQSGPPAGAGLPSPGLPSPGLPSPGLPSPGLPSPGLPSPGLHGLTAELVPARTGTARFDLSVALREHQDETGAPGGLDMMLEYSTDVFSPEAATALADRFTAVLTQVAADPAVTVADLEILLPGERAWLAGLNETSRDLPCLSLSGIFERAARLWPGRRGAGGPGGGGGAGRGLGGGVRRHGWRGSGTGWRGWRAGWCCWLGCCGGGGGRGRWLGCWAGRGGGERQ